MKYVPQSFYEESTRGILKGGEILICKDGALTGKVAIVPTEMPFDKAMINEHVFLLRTNEKAKQEYLFHFLYSTIGQSLLKANITGQAQGGLNSTNLNNIKIPLPPKTVQEKIITEIETLEKKEKAGREKVESLSQNVLNTFNTLSEQFEKLPLSKIISLQNGKGLSSAKMIKGEHLVYGGNGINGTHNAFVSENATIAIGRVGAYCGAVHLTEPKSWITDNSMFVNQFLKDLNLKFLYFALKNLNLNQFANQSSHPNISQPTVLGQKIPFPDKKEQDKIIIEIEKLETEIGRIETELATMDEQKEQILKKHLE